jgi:hypothetical protein
MNWVPSFLYFWVLANPKNRRRLRYRGTTSMHYVRAQQSLKYMDTELVMRAAGFKHEQDSDVIMQAIRKIEWSVE